MIYGLYNYQTELKFRVPSHIHVKKPQFDRLKKHIEKVETLFQWDVIIHGKTVRYRGNSFHVYDFWMDNFYPAKNDGSYEPDITIHVVMGVKENPSAFYCPETNEAIFLNTEYYGHVKSWALGMVTAALEPKGVHGIHGACAEVDGKGVVIIAPTGTGKTTQTYQLFMHDKGKILGDDWIFVHKKRGKFIALHPEKKLYIRTDIARDDKKLERLFTMCKCENVVEKNRAYDFSAYKNSRALLAREWLKGPQAVTDSAQLGLVVLLRRDNHSPAEVQLSPENAVEVLETGEFSVQPGAGPEREWGETQYQSWYNPYLLKEDREAQRKFFLQEFKKVPVLLLNTGPDTIDQTHNRIIRAIKKI